MAIKIGGTVKVSKYDPAHNRKVVTSVTVVDYVKKQGQKDKVVYRHGGKNRTVSVDVFKQMMVEVKLREAAKKSELRKLVRERVLMEIKSSDVHKLAKLWQIYKDGRRDSGIRKFDDKGSVKSYVEKQLNQKVKSVEFTDRDKTYPHNPSNPYTHNIFKVELADGTTFTFTHYWGRPSWTGKVAAVFGVSIENVKLNERIEDGLPYYGDGHDVELKWQGLSGTDANIGRFIVGPKDYDKLERQFKGHISFDLYDDKSPDKQVKYAYVVNAIKRSRYGKIAMKEKVNEAKYWLSPVGKVDDFKDPITDTIIDGKTQYRGAWALMTPKSWNEHGVGRLGIGYGQMYKKQADGKWLLVKGG